MADQATRVEMTGTPRVVRLTRAEFDALPEYSLSIPTGTTLGKRWKRDESEVHRLHGRRNVEPAWVMGEYYDIGDPTHVGIRWTPIEIVEEAPARPAAWRTSGALGELRRCITSHARVDGFAIVPTPALVAAVRALDQLSPEHVPALRAAAAGMQAEGLDPLNAVSWRLGAIADALEQLHGAADAAGAAGVTGEGRAP